MERAKVILLGVVAVLLAVIVWRLYAIEAAAQGVRGGLDDVALELRGGQL